MNLRKAGIAGAVALTLVLGGCGSNNDSGSGTKTDSPSTSDSSGQTGDAAEAITISYPADHQSFDPTKTVTAIDGAMFGQIGGRLTTLTLDGTIQNMLAENIELSDDYMSAVVTLKEGLKFSDGSDLLPSDVAATFTYELGVEGSTIGSLTDNFESVTATDTEVTFTFKAPFPSFPSAIAADGAMIFPESGLAKGDDFFNQPISAGLYKLDGSWSGNSVTLVANDHYYDGKAPFPEITFMSLADSNAVVSQMKSGQIQFSADLPPSYLEQFDGTGGAIKYAPGFGFYDLRLNNRVAPLDDANVRNAINLAIDREAIVNQIWQGNNEVQGGFWPRTLDGYNPDFNAARDLDAAKELLKGTECENGCTIPLMYSEADFPFANQVVLLTQSQLKDIGITIELDSVDQPTLIDRLVSGDYSIAPGANNSGGAFPDKLINDALLSTSGIKAEFTGYNSPEMDALVKEVVTSSGDDRAKAEEAVGELFEKDRPFVTYATRVRGQASSLPADAIGIVGSSLVIVPVR